MTHSRTLSEQDNFLEPVLKKQKTINTQDYDHFAHDPKVVGETMPVYFPRGLPDIVLNYLDDDMLPVKQPNNEAKSFSEPYTQFKLFGRTLSQLMTHEATVLGNMILHGEEAEVEEVLSRIREKPILLHIEVISTDPLGTPVKGKLLQIAAMAGDFDLKPGLVNEKDRGMVEKLAKAGALSKEEIIEQLQLIIGNKAEIENSERIQRYLNIMNKFVNDLAQINEDRKNLDLEEFRMKCKEMFNLLKTDLQAERSKLITSGYIFDTNILSKAVEFSKCIVKGFNCRWDETFWYLCFHELITKVSSRDAQIDVGKTHFVIDYIIPCRTLWKRGAQWDSYTSHDIDNSFYDYFKDPEVEHLVPPIDWFRLECWKEIAQRRATALHILCSVQEMDHSLHIAP